MNCAFCLSAWEIGIAHFAYIFQFSAENIQNQANDISECEVNLKHTFIYFAMILQPYSVCAEMDSEFIVSAVFFYMLPIFRSIDILVGSSPYSAAKKIQTMDLKEEIKRNIRIQSQIT